MTRETVIQNILTNYSQYGVTQEDIEPLIDESLKDGLSYDRIYFFLQLAITDVYELEFFWSTSRQMARALGTSDERMLEIMKEVHEEDVKEEDLDKPLRVPAEVGEKFFMGKEDREYDQSKLQRLIDIANKEYDGHFTLMKFTDDWGCCFGTLNDRMDSYYMAHGKTMEEAIENCIKNSIDIYKIDAAIKAQDILVSDIHRRIHCGMKYLECIKPTEYNHYSKRLYKFMNEYPDYRFVQIPINAKSLKEAIFTIDPMFIFTDSYSENGENKLGKDGYVDGFNLESIITPKKQFIKKRFRIKSEPYVLKHISYDFWKNYILHGEALFE